MAPESSVDPVPDAPPVLASPSIIPEVGDENALMNAALLPVIECLPPGILDGIVDFTPYDLLRSSGDETLSTTKHTFKQEFVNPDSDDLLASSLDSSESSSGPGNNALAPKKRKKRRDYKFKNSRPPSGLGTLQQGEVREFLDRQR